jgi:hypothetical protein
VLGITMALGYKPDHPTDTNPTAKIASETSSRFRTSPAGIVCRCPQPAFYKAAGAILKSAYYEVLRDQARVENNYAQRVLAQEGMAMTSWQANLAQVPMSD